MTSNITTELPEEYMDDEAMEDNSLRNTLLVITYATIMIVSLTGNCLVCAVVYSNRKLRTTTNLLIVSLTVSDILTTVLNIPFNCARIMLHNWPFPAFLCVLIPIVQVCCVYVSTITMAVISVHRYYSVSRHSTQGMSRYMSTGRLSLLIAGTWILSLMLSVPHSVFNRVVATVFNNADSVRCRAVYPDIDFNFPLWLTIEVLATQYLIPLSITCCLYIRIATIISRQGALAAHSTDETYRRYCEAKRKRIVMLVLVCLAFAACWLPLNAYHLLMDLHIAPHNYTAFLVVHSVAMSSVCYNPVIYCFMNQAFRRGAQNIFCVNALFCKKSGAGDYRMNGAGGDDDELNHRCTGGTGTGAVDESQPVVLTGVMEQTYV